MTRDNQGRGIKMYMPCTRYTCTPNIPLIAQSNLTVRAGLLYVNITLTPGLVFLELLDLVPLGLNSVSWVAAMARLREAETALAACLKECAQQGQPGPVPPQQSQWRPPPTPAPRAEMPYNYPPIAVPAGSIKPAPARIINTPSGPTMGIEGYEPPPYIIVPPRR